MKNRGAGDMIPRRHKERFTAKSRMGKGEDGQGRESKKKEGRKEGRQAPNFYLYEQERIAK
jgi:hypothetical protein